MTMNCAEFHKTLPIAIESGGNIDEQGHLATCKNCTDLVNDLRYIAEQAKLLLPMHDPSPRVWNNIQSSLQKEGIGRVRVATASTASKKKEWPTLGWAAALAASLLIGIALLQVNRQASQSEEVADASASSGPITPQSQPSNDSGAAASNDENDKQVLAEVASRNPGLKAIYESNLKNVNNYISDAKTSVQNDPNDSEAREHLREAYAQKAMLYDMATARSLQ
ncbi:MAG: hypothetical protein JWO13_3155 [Acidobacteriales bacterium]|nr:hypothetical protein [Terriglobales bacterium]